MYFKYEEKLCHGQQHYEANYHYSLFKGTVRAISNDPPCINGNALFTTASSVQLVGYRDICVLIYRNPLLFISDFPVCFALSSW